MLLLLCTMDYSHNIEMVTDQNVEHGEEENINFTLN